MIFVLDFWIDLIEITAVIVAVIVEVIIEVIVAVIVVVNTIVKEEKYQRYEPNDDFHECNVNFDTDEICDKGCSKYRNIDKIRIIYNYVDQLLKIKYLTQVDVLNYIIIKRNNIDYQDKLTPQNLLIKP